MLTLVRLSAIFEVWICCFLDAARWVQHVWGIEVFTTSEVEAVNGTSVKLKCTFSSTQPVSLQTVTVSWDFRSITSKSTERMFYYQEDPYPPEKGIFKGHVKWSGDIMRKDASITLNDVLPTFNGTYICQVVNPPDAHGSTGETILRVVNKGEAVLCTFFHSGGTVAVWGFKAAVFNIYKKILFVHIY
uniref:Ig-like domain-containing protein n=1 Tax=Xiphophorus couchianus TaxID=32473 RepID=A0A3B5LBG1_9TELE